MSTLNFFIGVSVALTASCLSSLGVNLQASALQKERLLNTLSEQDPVIFDDEWSESELLPEQSEQEDMTVQGFFSLLFNNAARNEESWKRLWFKTQWYLGFGMYLFCQLFGSVIALGFISPMIFAPFGSIGLIFNILFSSFFLGTRITFHDCLGTGLIVVGCAVVSTFGTMIPETRQNVDDLIKMFTKPAIFVVLLLAFMIKYLEYNLNSLKDALIYRSVNRRSSQRSFSADGSARFSATRSRPPILEFIDPALPQAPLVDSPVEERIPRTVSVGSLVRFSETVIIDADTLPLLRTSTTMSMRSTKRKNMSALVGVLYAIMGGMIASDTLTLTKSG
ncbi:hypothetical protein HDV01_001618 [Terramyces sp. JEL0728]|nr:hypothetical protein HDV01_001618 [Terramyces sp. JEL0728]